MYISNQTNPAGQFINTVFYFFSNSDGQKTGGNSKPEIT